MSDFCGEHTAGRDRIPGGFRGGDFQDVENAPKRGVVEEGGLTSNEIGRRRPDEVIDAGGCDAAAEDAVNVLRFFFRTFCCIVLGSRSLVTA